MSCRESMHMLDDDAHTMDYEKKINRLRDRIKEH